jgi:hypothetical protein
MKTKEVGIAYYALKGLKLGNIEEQTLDKLWRDLCAMRKIVADYEADRKDMQESLEDDDFHEMQERAQKSMKIEDKKKNEGYILTAAEETERREVLEYFTEYNKKFLNAFKLLDENPVKLNLELVDSSEMLKILKDNGKTFEDMEALEILIK